MTNAQLMLFLEVAVLFAAGFLILWLFLVRTAKDRRLHMQDAALSGGDLETHAKKTALEHAVSTRRSNPNWPLPRLVDNYELVMDVYKSLNEDLRKKKNVPPAAEWLLDNFYVLEEQVKGLRRDLRKKTFMRLPVLTTGSMMGFARIVAISVELVSHTDGQITEEEIAHFLEAYQTGGKLTDREIWALPLALRLALIEKLRHLCENVKRTQAQWHKADELVDTWLAHDTDDQQWAVRRMRDNLKTAEEANPAFIEHLFFRLRRSGLSYAHLLRIMDETLVKFSTTTERLTETEHNVQSLQTVSMGNTFTSLHALATLDWSPLFESASSIEHLLNEDPDGTYPKMDQRTRNEYRSRVERLATRHGVTEMHIAMEALALAKESHALQQADPRTYHVGYYLLGKGLDTLKARQEQNHGILHVRHPRTRHVIGLLYFGFIGLCTLALVSIAILHGLTISREGWPLLPILIGLICLIPASEIAMQSIDRVVCKIMKPTFFPRLELKDGIPADLGTIVVVPALLPDEGRIKELLRSLECHFLSNREDHLYFALVGGFMDDERPDSERNRLLVATALSGIADLNQKHAGTDGDRFYFFQRENRYNVKNNKWFGWERKRGALMEFNELVLGSQSTSFTHSSHEKPPFHGIRYIITLDSDTILPMGMARKMIGTMAHPLNRPIIDPVRGIVVEGYGLMQPRIDIEVDSANRSPFSRIFASQDGLDPYANAISDVYQDLFGEGIYTGKGIYDLAIFQEVLKQALPDDSILSHDLLEGCYARTGLVTDLRLVDSQPSKYASHAARQHRWARGDWQLLPHLSGVIVNTSQQRIANPLSLLSRWKIFDNLRRSLLAPSLLVLGILGFCLLPGSPAFWLGAFFLTLCMPLWAAMIGRLFSVPLGPSGLKRYMPSMIGLKAAFLKCFLTLAFLPHQAWSMSVAAVITCIRVGITRKNLLQWVTSADLEKTLINTSAHHVKTMAACPVAGLLLAMLTTTLQPGGTLLCIPLALLWALAPWLAYHVSQDFRPPAIKLSDTDRSELGRLARRTWRYFEEFTDAKNHFLAPDNHQIDPPRGTACRTSPTNIGLGLMAILTARDFGYISTGELVEHVSRTVQTMETLEKWNGHLYNWYDTRTLLPLKPRYVSTVDSGNLACYLITLEHGLRSYLHSPLIDGAFTRGLRDTLHCAGKNGLSVFETIAASLPLPDSASPDLTQWGRTLLNLIDGPWLAPLGDSLWKSKITHSFRMLRNEWTTWFVAIEWADHMPTAFQEQPSLKHLPAAIALLPPLHGACPSLSELPALWRQTADKVRELREGLHMELEPEVVQEAGVWLAHLEACMKKTAESARQAVERCEALLVRIRRLGADMPFAPLYDSKTQLFSIGFDLDSNKLSNAHYDLFASEARQTSYLAIARNEIPVTHWSRMGRSLTVMDGYKGLVSWTGTMFEYLMPLLVMKRYANTLLDETYAFVIRNQKKYGKQRNMPWGASESGFNGVDASLDYQYKAIGVPWLGLKRGLIEDAVAAPYATFLALAVDPAGSIRNLMRLESEGLDGPYGLYEAADYTPERLPFDAKCAVVKSYMAHHQGMSLMALGNLFHKNIMQERFHTEPAIHAARLLLQEKTPSRLLLTKDKKEKVIPFMESIPKDVTPMRRFVQSDPDLPKAHILTNGTYSVLLTDRGTGYSRSKMMAITRWRSDTSLDLHGMFFYLRNMETDKTWSATQAPCPENPSQYEVVFTADKATFRRLDGAVATETEVVVVSGDNAEIRRITLKNHGATACTVEVTSCYEVVLAPQASDVAHPAFSNLFVQTGWLEDRRCLVANRRPRTDTDKEAWLAHAVISNGDMVGNIQFETDRLQWLGRGRSMSDPILQGRGKPLTSTVGAVLDPVMVLRAAIRIEPGKTAGLSFLTAIAGSREQLLSLVDRLSTPETVENAFRLALTRSQVEYRYLNMTATEISLYQDLIADLVYISPLRKTHQAILRLNGKGQSALWPFGISGDRPIVLLSLDKTQKIDILYEVLRAHEYWRLMDMRVDLVILDEEAHSYHLPLHNLISDIVLSRQTHDILKRPGDVFILDKTRMTEEDVILLHAAARIILRGDGRSLAEQAQDRPDMKWPAERKFVRHSGTDPIIPTKEPEWLRHNGLGGFRPDGQEYVIRLEKGMNTPTPWVNVIANPTFGFLVSESGSGYTWSENSRENKLTPWSNDAVADPPGEVLYIGDAESGALWGATALPIREEEPYLVRHGFGYSVFEHNSHGIEQWMTQHVPVDASVKVTLLGLRNVSNRRRHLTLTYYLRPVLGVSDQVTAPHVRTSLSTSGCLLMQNSWQEDFAGTVCFLESSVTMRSVTGDRKEFFGNGDIRSPECMKRERLSGRVGAGFDPCGAMQVHVTLDPNERREIVFLLGTGRSAEEAENLAASYRTVEKARASLARVKAFWKGKMNVIRVKTPGAAMNLMMDGWLAYQVISCRLWARSGFYQAGGAFGFRDQLQDCLAIAPIWPETSRSQILLHAAHQFAAGDVQHWWHAPGGAGTRTRISDDLLWLPYVTAEYIRISGDEAILDEVVPFLEEPVLSEFEEERYGRPALSPETATLFEHCARALDHALCFGVHGLPKMGTGDWNDGMNTVGNKGKGESVWLGWFLIAVLDAFVPFCTKRTDDERVNRYASTRHILHHAIEQEAWDGNWYRRAWFDNGQMLGTAQNNECKIDSVAQTWAVISGAGDPERAVQAMTAVDDWLVRREEGLVKLLTPPFGDGELEPGYIKGYLPGIRENGGQYTHAAVWAVIAFALMGNGEKAWELFELINPINHTSSRRDCARYKTEPYVMAADVYSVHPHAGRGGWSWYTGSAGWMYRAGLEFLLGFRKTGQSVIMAPCIPRTWNEYGIVVHYGDTIHDIRVRNPDGVNRGIRSIRYDGALIDGDRFVLANDGKRHDVEVTMGEGAHP